MEAVKVIGKYRSFTKPLAVKLAPERLAPAGIGNRKMKSVGAYAVPVFCCNIMSQCIGVGMGRKLGISRGSGGEEHKSSLISCGCILASVIMCAVKFVFLIKCMPAFSFFPFYYDLRLKRGACFLSDIHLMGRIPKTCTEDS